MIFTWRANIQRVCCGSLSVWLNVIHSLHNYLHIDTSSLHLQRVCCGSLSVWLNVIHSLHNYLHIDTSNLHLQTLNFHWVSITKLKEKETKDVKLPETWTAKVIGSWKMIPESKSIRYKSWYTDTRPNSHDSSMKLKLIAFFIETEWAQLTWFIRIKFQQTDQFLHTNLKKRHWWPWSGLQAIAWWAPIYGPSCCRILNSATVTFLMLIGTLESKTSESCQLTL